MEVDEIRKARGTLIRMGRQSMNSPTVNKERTTMSVQMSLRRSEYENLRQEIIKRIELSHNFIFWAVGAGAFLGLADDKGSDGITSGRVLLLAPILAAALCFPWGSNLVRLSELGAYLRRLEHQLCLEIGWETYIEGRRRRKWMSSWADLMLGLVFPGLQFIAVYTAIDRFGSLSRAWDAASGMLLFDIGLFVLTGGYILYVHRLFLRSARGGQHEHIESGPARVQAGCLVNCWGSVPVSEG